MKIHSKCKKQFPKEDIAMAKKIQTWVEFGPCLEPTNLMEDDGLTKNIVATTNQNRGGVLAVLAGLDM